MKEQKEKLKFMTTIGRLDTDGLSREAWQNGQKIAVLEKVNDEWLVSFIPLENQVTFDFKTMREINSDFERFLFNVQ